MEDFDISNCSFPMIAPDSTYGVNIPTAHTIASGCHGSPPRASSIGQNYSLNSLQTLSSNISICNNTIQNHNLVMNNKYIPPPVQFYNENYIKTIYTTNLKLFDIRFHYDIWVYITNYNKEQIECNGFIAFDDEKTRDDFLGWWKEYCKRFDGNESFQSNYPKTTDIHNKYLVCNSIPDSLETRWKFILDNDLVAKIYTSEDTFETYWVFNDIIDAQFFEIST